MRLRAEDRKIELSLDMGTVKKLFVNNDRSRLEQVMINLLSNAIKFTLPHGKVNVRIETFKHKGGFYVHVSDSGIGIRSEDQPGLFKEFSRVVDHQTIQLNPQGNGLGLWISSRLCEAMGSNKCLRVTSTHGIGSTFSFFVSFDLENQKNTPKGQSQEMTTIREEQSEYEAGTIIATDDRGSILDGVSQSDVELSGIQEEVGDENPVNCSGCSQYHHSTVHTGVADDVVIKASRNNQRHQCQPTILVVDDDALNRLILSSFLEARNLVHEVASDGHEALQLIKIRNSKFAQCACRNYSLIIMDYEMPIMNGPDCCRRIKHLTDRGQLSGQTVVGHTAYCSPEDLAYFRSCGAVDILEKPVTEENFSQLLEKWFHKRKC